MKKVIWKPYWDFEREENWLNNMAAQGFALTRYTWCRYVFESCEKGEYIYRLELLDNMPGNPQSNEYLRFMEEAGVECVSTYLRWVYFRKKASEGAFELYTDIDSNINHCRRVNNFWFTLAVAELLIGFSNISIGLSNIDRIGLSYFNLPAGILLFVLGLFFFHLSWKMRKKIRQLLKKKTIRE